MVPERYPWEFLQPVCHPAGHQRAEVGILRVTCVGVRPSVQPAGVIIVSRRCVSAFSRSTIDFPICHARTCVRVLIPSSTSTLGEMNFHCFGDGNMFCLHPCTTFAYLEDGIKIAKRGMISRTDAHTSMSSTSINFMTALCESASDA